MKRVSLISNFALFAFFTVLTIGHSALSSESVASTQSESRRQIRSELELFDNGKLIDHPIVMSLENEPSTISVGDSANVYEMKYSVTASRMGSQTNGRDDLKLQIYLAHRHEGKLVETSTTILMVSGTKVQLPLSEKDHLYFTLNSELVPN